PANATLPKVWSKWACVLTTARTGSAEVRRTTSRSSRPPAADPVVSTTSRPSSPATSATLRSSHSWRQTQTRSAISRIGMRRRYRFRRLRGRGAVNRVVARSAEVGVTVLTEQGGQLLRGAGDPVEVDRGAVRAAGVDPRQQDPGRGHLLQLHGRDRVGSGPGGEGDGLAELRLVRVVGVLGAALEVATVEAELGP